MIWILRTVCVGALVLFVLFGFRALFLFERMEDAKDGEVQETISMTTGDYERFLHVMAIVFLVFVISLSLLIEQVG